LVVKADEGADTRTRTGRWWHAPLAWCLALGALLPFALMIWTAQKPHERVDDAYYYLAQQMPEREVRRKVAIDPRPLRVALINSVIVSTVCAVSSVALGALAGYAFAKKEFRGKTLLFDLVLVSMAIPAVVLMVPLFRLCVALGIYDTLLALILPFSVTGFSIFYMRYAIASVPDATVEAARLDGLSELGALWRVVLPSIGPSVVTLAVLQFILNWNSFVLPHALIASPQKYTIGILLGRLMADFGGLMWNDIMIVVIAALIPVLAAYLAFNRWVLRGATAVGADRTPTL